MKSKLRRLLVVIAITGLSGCETNAPRVALIPPIVHDETGVPSDLVKLGPDPIRVYVMREGTWVLSANKVNVEGWLAAPPPPRKADAASEEETDDDN